MKQILFCAILTFVMSGNVASSALAGVDDGWVAYERGDYATAIKIMRPLAVQGNVEARHVLGKMYGLVRRTVRSSEDLPKHDPRKFGSVDLGDVGGRLARSLTRNITYSKAAYKAGDTG